MTHTLSGPIFELPSEYVSTTDAMIESGLRRAPLKKLYKKHNIETIFMMPYKVVRRKDFDEMLRKEGIIPRPKPEVTKEIPDNYLTMAALSKLLEMPSSTTKHLILTGEVEYLWDGLRFWIPDWEAKRLEAKSNRLTPPKGWYPMHLYAKDKGISKSAVEDYVWKYKLPTYKRYTDPETNRPGVMFLSPETIEKLDEVLDSLTPPKDWIQVKGFALRYNNGRSSSILRFLRKNKLPFGTFSKPGDGCQRSYAPKESLDAWLEDKRPPPEGWQSVIEFQKKHGYYKRHIRCRVTASEWQKKFGYYKGPESPFPRIYADEKFLLAVADRTPTLRETRKRRQRVARALCGTCKTELAHEGNDYCSIECKNRKRKSDIGVRYCLGCGEVVEQVFDEPWKHFIERVLCIACKGNYVSVRGLTEARFAR